MWNSIESLKQSLHKIAKDVHDEESLQIHEYADKDDVSNDDRETSDCDAPPSSSFLSPFANTINYSSNTGDRNSRWHPENLDETKTAFNISGNMNSKTVKAFQKNGGQSSTQQKMTSIRKKYTEGSIPNGILMNQDLEDNGKMLVIQSDVMKIDNEKNGLPPHGKEKELEALLEEQNRSMTSLQASYELQIQQLRLEFEHEHDSLSKLQLQLQEGHELNESLQEELKLLKMGKDETSMDGVKLAISRLEKELSEQEVEDADHVSESGEGKSEATEKENSNIKIVIATGNSRAEEMELMLRKCEEDLIEACRERDKAMRELSRLKQHLLEKASAESEKIDEDGKIIDELRESNHLYKAQISQLEKALSQVIADKEEVKMVSSIEMEKSKKMVQDLLATVANSMNTIKVKDVEIANLQTALGQYFAELETKENLELQLAVARDESTKLSKHIKDAEQSAGASRHEIEELSGKLSHREQMLTDTKFLADKLQKENAKLRTVLEQAMARLNRMSADSDFLADRRIVIKLLITYFERNHSQEVLGLMVRMLGFSEEEKQRIGIAQQGGRIARGVWGIPSRLVGGILGGSSSSNAPSSVTSQNQVRRSTLRSGVS